MKVDFSANFHPKHELFFGEGSLPTQKLENEKIKSQTSISWGIKLNKREGGVFSQTKQVSKFSFF